MSQNKTIIPGVDYNSYNKSTDDSSYGSMYSRSSSDDKRTFVPGVNHQATTPVGVIGHRIPSSTEGKAQRITLQERVVVGVLFSVSRGLLGELFPLYLGKNIIGQTPNCDVVLRERTVSPAHAILHVKKLERGYEANITDYNSMYGTSVNEEDGRYDTLSVKENDIIGIGAHYKFVVKFFEIGLNGMVVDEEFDELGDRNSIEPAQNDSDVSNDFYRPSPKENEDSSRTVIY